ncbi:MAG: hypothetical protein M0010_16005 [Actinomycetota bacterium]|nr:hypothetical protein [Actinomycetota bacterium]
MSDDLANYLGAIDSHLVAHLDARGEISDEATRHVQCYAVAMIEGLVVPEIVHEDWPDFFPLVVALVLAYGSARLGHLARQSAIFEGGGDDPLTDGDRSFLVTLLAELRDLGARREQ